MQVENDYDKEVYNGDIGYIDDVDPNAGEIVASFDAVRHLRIWGTRHAGAGLCRHYSQEPRLRISRGGHPSADTALRHAAAEPALHRRHTGQAAGRVGRAEEGRGHRRPKRVGSAALVQAGRVADVGKSLDTRALIKALNPRPLLGAAETHSLWSRPSGASSSRFSGSAAVFPVLAQISKGPEGLEIFAGRPYRHGHGDDLCFGGQTGTHSKIAYHIDF